MHCSLRDRIESELAPQILKVEEVDFGNSPPESGLVALQNSERAEPAADLDESSSNRIDILGDTADAAAAVTARVKKRELAAKQLRQMTRSGHTKAANRPLLAPLALPSGHGGHPAATTEAADPKRVSSSSKKGHHSSREDSSEDSRTKPSSKKTAHKETNLIDTVSIKNASQTANCVPNSPLDTKVTGI